MDNVKLKKLLLYISAFLLVVSLGLFNYYDKYLLAKTFLYSQNYHLYYICKVIILYLFPILAILICHKIEREDTSKNLIFPICLLGIIVILFSLGVFTKYLSLSYWLTGYSIISAFCLINIFKKVNKKGRR